VFVFIHCAEYLPDQFPRRVVGVVAEVGRFGARCGKHVSIHASNVGEQLLLKDKIPRETVQPIYDYSADCAVFERLEDVTERFTCVQPVTATHTFVTRPQDHTIAAGTRPPKNGLLLNLEAETLVSLPIGGHAQVRGDPHVVRISAAIVRLMDSTSRSVATAVASALLMEKQPPWVPGRRERQLLAAHAFVIGDHDQAMTCAVNVICIEDTDAGAEIKFGSAAPTRRSVASCDPDTPLATPPTQRHWRTRRAAG
jgi:hypothetical protein